MKSTEGFFPDIVRGVFLSRPNRFVVECMTGDRPVKAYLPNPGRLWELLFPGTVLYLARHDAAYRGSMDFTVVAVERESIPIMLHTHVNNLVARRLIEEGRIPGLEGATIEQQEKTIGSSRFDFLVHQGGSPVVVEIKSCTLVGNSIAMFPDAVTARGTRHVRELELLSREGLRTAVVFLIHWPHARYFLPEHHTDLEFSRTLLSVKERVMVRAMTVEWTPGMEVGRVQEAVIPWSIVEKEAHDRGSYIFIMRLRRDRNLTIGGLGNQSFPRGYYLYVGSAREHLTKRIERHRRLTKKQRWHIDYLRAAADVHAAIPVRASDDLECAMARALEAIADWRITGFGSSDCSCPTHLFGMHEDPLHSRPFIMLLQYFRIDRLERMLGTVSGGRGEEGEQQ